MSTPPGTSEASTPLVDPITPSRPYYALDLQAAPGAPQTTAVTLANFDISPSAAEVVIYDGSTQRSNPLVVTQYPYSSLQWGSTDTTLYSVDEQEPQDFLVLGVGPSGAVLNQNYNRVVSPYSSERFITTRVQVWCTPTEVRPFNRPTAASSAIMVLLESRFQIRL